LTATSADPNSERDVSFALEGRLTALNIAPVWAEAVRTLERNPQRRIVVDASRLEYIDATGIALVFDLKRRQRPAGAEIDIRGLAANLAALIPDHRGEDVSRAVEKPPALVERYGQALG
jgi:phospholipid/cholesterol/gamma-HCH transport system permease protein